MKLHLVSVSALILLCATLSTALECHRCAESSIRGSIQSDDHCGRHAWMVDRCLDNEVCVYSNITVNGVTRTNRKCARPTYCDETYKEADRETNDFHHECFQCETNLCNDFGSDVLLIVLCVVGALLLLLLTVGGGYFGYNLVKRLYLN